MAKPKTKTLPKVWASQAVARDLEAERDALRAELAAARDEIAKLKTCRHEWGDPQTKDGMVKTCQLCGVGGTDCAAEKARADKAEQRVRELEDMIAAAADVDPKQASYDSTITTRTSKAMRACEVVLAEGRAILAAREQKEGGR